MNRLRSSEVHIRLLSTDQVDGSTLDRFALTLSAEELTRAYHLKTEDLRTEFIAAHGALREMLGGYLSTDPSAIILSSGRHQKPKVVHPADSDLEFGLAHSGGKVAYAFATGRPVGIDIEAISEAKCDPQLAETFLADEELRKWLSLPHELKLSGFFRAWTRKEAFLKAIGKGLALDPRSFSVTCDPREPAKLFPPGEHADQQWNLHALELCDGFEAAVVVEGTGYDLVVR